MIKIFPSIDLDSIVSDDVNPDYSSLSTALFFAAADAESKGDDIQNKILSLLYEACHTRLQIENPYNPFDDNFTDSEIDFFAAIVKQIDNPLIKARLSDRVWNSPRHRNIGFALLAIDTYTSAPLDFDTWYGEGERCWQRAINLCLLIGKGAGDRLEKIEDKVFDTLMSTTTQHRFFGHSLANVLQTIDVIQNRQVRVAEKLKSSAGQIRHP